VLFCFKVFESRNDIDFESRLASTDSFLSREEVLLRSVLFDFDEDESFSGRRDFVSLFLAFFSLSTLDVPLFDGSDLLGGLEEVLDELFLDDTAFEGRLELPPPRGFVFSGGLERELLAGVSSSGFLANLFFDDVFFSVEDRELVDVLLEDGLVEVLVLSGLGFDLPAGGSRPLDGSLTFDGSRGFRVPRVLSDPWKE